MYNLILASYLNIFGIYFADINKIKIDNIIKPALITKNNNKINGVIMNYESWNLLSPNLKNFSYNIILTYNISLLLKKNNFDNVYFTSNMEEAVIKFNNNKNIESVYVVGDNIIYNIIQRNIFLKNNIKYIYLYIFKKKYHYNDYKYINIKETLKYFIINLNNSFFHNDYVKLIAHKKY